MYPIILIVYCGGLFGSLLDLLTLTDNKRPARLSLSPHKGLLNGLSGWKRNSKRLLSPPRACNI